MLQGFTKFISEGFTAAAEGIKKEVSTQISGIAESLKTQIQSLFESLGFKGSKESASEATSNLGSQGSSAMKQFQNGKTEKNVSKVT